MKSSIFDRFAFWSFLSIFILFFLGGLVRATGSGMGCPDWPKCFGQWVPPASEAELPADYESLFAQKRHKKVERLVTFLQQRGMDEKAAEIQQAGWLFEHEPYSFRKAYTEYINRLWGALTGIIVLGTFISSLFLIKSDLFSFLLSFAGLVLVWFNGWLGSLVVDTHLFEGMVTLHFLLAFCAFAAFLVAWLRHKPMAGTESRPLWMLIPSILLLLSIVQVVAGSLVREQVDSLAREQVLIGLSNYKLLGTTFDVHRISSMVVLALTAWLLRSYLQSGARKKMLPMAFVLLGTVVLQISSGAANLSFSFPALAQTTHITLGAGTFALSLYIFVQEYRIRRAMA